MQTGGIVKARFNKIFTGDLGHLFQILTDDIPLGDPAVPVMNGQAEPLQSLQPVHGFAPHIFSGDDEDTNLFFIRWGDQRLGATTPQVIKAIFAREFLDLNHDILIFNP
jgi:hypothetical protein